jgi:3-hydroxyisobutyrate dehydrogenase-like beta-hydroxyacid dehydrogenase
MFGRPEAAAAAKLNFALAGASETVEIVRPILSHLGTTWPMGDDPRHGHAAKIAGNFLISTAIESMAEAAALLRSKAADPALFLTMMGETLFSSFIYRSYGTAIATGISPGQPSGLTLPLKDNGLMLGEAEGGQRFPFAEVVRERLRGAVDNGLDQEDWSTALSKEAGRSSS